MEATRKTRNRPGLLRALGDQSLPETVQVDGCSYSLETTYKHDSWAATGLYAGNCGRIVCKFHRTQRIGVLPARWMGAASRTMNGICLNDSLDWTEFPGACRP